MGPTELNTSMEGTGRLQTTTFLSQEIGNTCLARLLGIGSSRLKKGQDLKPDLRFGQTKSGSAKETWSIDAFFTTLHESVAETLPDRPCRVYKEKYFQGLSSLMLTPCFPMKHPWKVCATWACR